MRLLATVAVLLLCAVGQHAADLPYDVCDGAPFVPSAVTLDPSPLEAGSEAHFQINGTADHEMQGGTFKATVSMVVHHFKVPVYTETKSLCDRTSCPIDQGPVTFTYDKMLPSITPPGNYLVKIEAFDEDQSMEMCLEVDFKIRKDNDAPEAQEETVLDLATLKLAWLGIEPKLWEGPDGTGSEDDNGGGMQRTVVY